MIKYLQRQVTPQMLLLLMGSIIMLTLTSAYLYVFKQPFSQYRQSLQILDKLKHELESDISLGSQIESVEAGLVQLEKKLQRSAPQLSINQQITSMIGHLGTLSVNHDVKLSRIEPGEVARMFMFQELSFNIEITGSYFGIFDWLQQVQNELGPIVVKQFDMTPDTIDGSRHMRLTLVSYRYEHTDKQ